MTSRTSALIVHNTVSPYRLPLFERLADDLDIQVLFCRTKEDHRQWKTSLEKWSFDSAILPNVQFGPFTINPGILGELWSRDVDVYVIGEDTMNLPSTIVTLCYAAYRGKPVILWSGAIEHEFEYKESWLKRRLFFLYRSFQSTYRRVIYRFPDKFIAYSTLSLNYLTARGVDSNDVVIGGQVMPAVELPEIPPPENDSDTTTILYLGYLQRRKGVETLIDAFRSLPEKFNAELVICGDGADRDRLSEMASHDSISFPGYVEGVEKAEWYQRADIFVLPTLHDPWGLVVNEALYYDTPVITTERAGVSDLVRNSDFGIVIPADDPVALSNAIATILDGYDAVHSAAVAAESGTDVDQAAESMLGAIREVVATHST